MTTGPNITLTHDQILDACTLNPQWVAGTMLKLLAQVEEAWHKGYQQGREDMHAESARWLT